MSAPHPLAEAEPAPVPAPEPNCMLNSMGVDGEKLGSLLNIMLSLTVQLLYNGNDDSQKQDLMKKMTCVKDQMEEFMDSQSSQGQGLLEGLLGPVLKLVDDLLEALLGGGGLLEGVVQLLTQLIQLLLCILTGLGLDVDVQVMVKLGNLLSIDLGVLLNLG